MSTVYIPWWGKIGLKLVLSRVPFGYALWQRIGLFRHGQMDKSDYAIGVFERHVKQAGLSDLKGKLILELGPGDGVATAVIAASVGARAVLVDAGAFVREDVAPYQALAKVLAMRGMSPPDLSKCETLDHVLTKCNARYLTNGLASLREIDSESVDLIFSQAVLEHVRRYEFQETLLQCARVLKDDGICSHQVDLRDHLGGALNNLRFSERIWESRFFAGSGFYTNRIQFTSMLKHFRRAGFEEQLCDVRRWDSLPTPRGAIARIFQELSDDELRVSGFDVLLRKSPANHSLHQR